MKAKADASLSPMTGKLISSTARTEEASRQSLAIGSQPAFFLSYCQQSILALAHGRLSLPSAKLPPRVA